MQQLVDDIFLSASAAFSAMRGGLEYDFNGWGERRSSTGSTANSQQYKGRLLAYRRDPDVGPDEQYAMHHRNYDPKTATFTSAAPPEDDSNLYRYVKNNPVNKDDPSGLEEKSREKLVLEGLIHARNIVNLTERIRHARDTYA